MEILNIQNSLKKKKYKGSIKKEMKTESYLSAKILWYNWFFVRQNSSNEHNDSNSNEIQNANLFYEKMWKAVV